MIYPILSSKTFVFQYEHTKCNSLLGRMISQTKPLKIKSFLPFNFSITKICVAIRLAEDGTRMDGINYPLVSNHGEQRKIISSFVETFVVINNFSAIQNKQK